MKKVLISITVSLLVGCVQTPTTKMSYHGFKYSNPKQDIIGSFEFTLATNGTMTIKAKNISATNDAGVIASSAQGQVDIINATGQQVGNAAAAVAKAVVKP